MPINEVFPNPTVKVVIFQIRFPNLFYIESKIGDLQIKIMEKFPESKLLFRKKMLFADVGSNVLQKDISKENDMDSAEKIWQFKSPKNFSLNVLTDSLDITSKHHKTYNNDKEGVDKFRDIIEFVLEHFLEVTKIPLFKRIGLRYIDECPIEQKNNESFLEYYNSVFPLDRYSLEDAIEMDFKTIVHRNSYNLRYVESLQQNDGTYSLVLDFDGFANNIKSNEALSITDALHEIILEEFSNSIKGPLIDYMRRER